MHFNHHYELTEYAKENGYNNLRFTLIAKNLNSMKFQFLDAYFGFIQQINGNDEVGGGFMRIDKLQQYALSYIVEVE